MVDRLLEVSLTAWKGEGRNECLIGIAAKRMQGSAEGLNKKKKATGILQTCFGKYRYNTCATIRQIRQDGSAHAPVAKKEEDDEQMVPG
jgi:hypothetical protein